jgi:hypothetical protein
MTAWMSSPVLPLTEKEREPQEDMSATVAATATKEADLRNERISIFIFIS